LRKITSFLVAGALLAACSGGSSSAPSTGGGSSNNIDATVHEWQIDLSSHTASAGEVTFNIQNTGEETHEFVVVSTDLAEGDLPVVDDQIPEDSDQLTAVDEQEDIEAGTSTSLTVNLDPGHYVIFCNLLAHYGKGMHASVTVE